MDKTGWGQVGARRLLLPLFSATGGSQLDPVMEQPPKTQPSPGDDPAADSSPSSGTERTPSGSSDPEPAPQDSKDSSVDFILDTGVPVHATACADLLSDPRPPEEGAGASFPTRAGEDHPVAAVGTIVTPDFVLAGVRLVPGLGHRRTLISVRQLALQGLTVTFGRDSCQIKEENTGNLVGEGRLREDRFYYISYLRIPQS
ncbi:unnamed protein product [Urochloa humidicola]